MEIVSRSGNVVKINSDWDAEVNGGRLCEYGRFDPLYDVRPRITSPMLRLRGKLEPVSWDEALQAVAENVGKASAKDLGILASTGSTNEALYLLAKLFCKELKATNVGILNDVAPKLAEKAQGKVADTVASDVILVVGCDPLKDQPVSSFFVKRSVDKGARLIVVDGKDNGLAPFAYMTLEMAEIGKAIEIAERATNPAVLYGAGVSDKAAAALKKLQGKASFVAIENGVNTWAAGALGLNNGFKPSGVKVLFTLLGEQKIDDQFVSKNVDKKAFVIAQASFVSPLTERADVVLPTAIWSERSGSLTNTEGRILKVNKAIEPKGEAKPDWEVLSLLANKLGKKLGATLDEISARATQEIK